MSAAWYVAKVTSLVDEFDATASSGSSLEELRGLSVLVEGSLSLLACLAHSHDLSLLEEARVCSSRVLGAAQGLLSLLELKLQQTGYRPRLAEDIRAAQGHVRAAFKLLSYFQRASLALGLL